MVDPDPTIDANDPTLTEDQKIQLAGRPCEEWGQEACCASCPIGTYNTFEGRTSCKSCSSDPANPTHSSPAGSR